MIDDGLIERSKTLGILFHQQLNLIKEEFESVLKYTLGRGLLAALIFQDNHGNPLSKLCDSVCEKALRKGLLLVHTGRESIKLAPPLSIHEEALLEGLQVLRECIAEAIEDQR